MHFFRKIIVCLVLYTGSAAHSATQPINILEINIRNDSGKVIPNFHQAEDGSQYITPISPLPKLIPVGASRYLFQVHAAPQNADPMLSLIAGDSEPANGFEVSIRTGETVMSSYISQGPSKVYHFSSALSDDTLTVVLSMNKL